MSLSNADKIKNLSAYIEKKKQDILSENYSHESKDKLQGEIDRLEKELLRLTNKKFHNYLKKIESNTNENNN